MELEAASKLARDLMSQFGLTEAGWTFKWDRALKRHAACHWSPKRCISLSEVITPLVPEVEAEDSIRHEIAHALAGARAGHGPDWKRVAVQVGARPERCVAPEYSNLIQAPWVGICPVNPEHTSKRHQQPVRVRSCGKCSPGVFDPRFLIRDWMFNGRPTQPSHPKYVRELREIERKYGLGIDAKSGVTAAPVRPSFEMSGYPKREDPLAVACVTYGSTIIVGGRDRFTGLVGKVEKIGRSRYHVRISTRGSVYEGQIVTVPFGIAKVVSDGS